jgi:hypothetical protein
LISNLRGFACNPYFPKITASLTRRREDAKKIKVGKFFLKSTALSPRRPGAGDVTPTTPTGTDYCLLFPAVNGHGKIIQRMSFQPSAICGFTFPAYIIAMARGKVLSGTLELPELERAILSGKYSG